MQKKLSNPIKTRKTTTAAGTTGNSENMKIFDRANFITYDLVVPNGGNVSQVDYKTDDADFYNNRKEIMRKKTADKAARHENNKYSHNYAKRNMRKTANYFHKVNHRKVQLVKIDSIQYQEEERQSVVRIIVLPSRRRLNIIGHRVLRRGCGWSRSLDSRLGRACLVRVGESCL